MHRGQLADTITSPTSSPADSLSNPTINPADYQGWWTYTNPEYGFSLLVPQDWIVEEIPPNDPLLGGHLINLHPSVSIHGENIRITFKQTGEETLLWPTGVGQGEFIPQGTLEIDGEPALRYQIVCPSGETTSIWYHQAEGAQLSRGESLNFRLFSEPAPLIVSLV